MEIEVISAAEANAILIGRHYLGAKARFAHICSATHERDAVAVYAPPVAASIDRKIFELARWWQSDVTPPREPRLRAHGQASGVLAEHPERMDGHFYGIYEGRWTAGPAPNPSAILVSNSLPVANFRSASLCYVIC
jgi:hypothetical protein